MPSKYKTDFVTIKGRKIVLDNMPLNVALKKLKQRVEDSGIMEIVRSKQQYEKPTTERKRKRSAARARWIKKQKELNTIAKYD